MTDIFIEADLLKEDWHSKLEGVEGVVSCVGAFGSDDFMLKINGSANVAAVSAALKNNVSRFVYISAVESNLPSVVLKGYFEGKRMAEEAVLDGFGEHGFVLRPGFIYGTRNLGGGIHLPLGLIGKPLEFAFNLPLLSNLQHIPGMKAVLAPPVRIVFTSMIRLCRDNMFHYVRCRWMMLDSWQRAFLADKWIARHPLHTLLTFQPSFKAPSKSFSSLFKYNIR